MPQSLNYTVMFNKEQLKSINLSQQHISTGISKIHSQGEDVIVSLECTKVIIPRALVIHVAHTTML
jgi:hypothetical protein